MLAGAVAAASIAIGGVINAAVAGAMAFGGAREPDPEILRFAGNLGYPLIAVVGMFATALAIALLAVQARRAGVFSKGLTTFSLIVAVITLASVLFVPMLAMLIWFFVIASVLWRSADASAAARPTGV